MVWAPEKPRIRRGAEEGRPLFDNQDTFGASEMPGNRQSMVSLTVDKAFMIDLIVYDCDVMGLRIQIRHQSTLAHFFSGVL